MREYPIVPDIHAEIKIFAGIFIKDIIMMFLICGLAMMISGQFPDGQYSQAMIFRGIGIVLAIYLDLRPRTNPGKRNYEVIWMMAMNLFEDNAYKSLDYYEFQDKQKIEVLKVGN